MKFYDRLSFSCLLIGEQSKFCGGLLYLKKHEKQNGHENLGVIAGVI